MFKIAVLVSGNGTNLKAIIDNVISGYLEDVLIEVVLSSNERAYAIQYARDFNLNYEVLSRKNYRDNKVYNQALISILDRYDLNLIVLAGFLVILEDEFIQKYQNRIINIHPSLIPSFCGSNYYGGLKVHEKVLEYGVKITGATVHFVNLEVDAGPIILQRNVEVSDNDTPEILSQHVMREAEWIILSEAIKLISQRQIAINGRIVKILNKEDKNSLQ